LEGSLNSSHRSREHSADLARLEVAELLPHELTIQLVISTVEEDRMKMGIQPQIRRRPLHHRDRARLRAMPPASRRALGVERLHSLDEASGQYCEQSAVLREPPAPLEWKGQDPLPKRHLGEHMLD
jgi:hypothetical protein